MTEPKFEIKESSNTFLVFDLLPAEARWLATFQFFKDAKAFVDSQMSQPTDSAQAAPTCGLRDRLERVLGEWWFWEISEISAKGRAEILDGLMAATLPSTERDFPAGATGVGLGGDTQREQNPSALSSTPHGDAV